MGKWLKRQNRKGRLGGDLHLGQWFWFVDDGDEGYCQPDAYLVRSRDILLIEIKRSWRTEAIVQLEQLYGPVLEYFYGLPTLKVVICKYIRDPDVGSHTLPSLQKLLAYPVQGTFTYQHLA